MPARPADVTLAAATPAERDGTSAPDPTAPAAITEALEIGRLVRAQGELRLANEQLSARVRELDALVERRTQRTYQLMGERRQLEARLAERDRQVQALNRELGAASVPGRPVAGAAPVPTRPVAPPAAPAWHARLRAWVAGLVGRLRGPGAGSPARPVVRRPATSGKPAPLAPGRGAGPPAPVVAVAAFGLDGADLERVLEIVERHCAERGLRPLILTDQEALAPLRARRLIFEYLPPPARRQRHAPQLDWELYLQRRLALCRRKWQPIRIIAFGRPAADMVAFWSSSPFEDPSIAGLLGHQAGAEPWAGSEPAPSDTTRC